MKNIYVCVKHVPDSAANITIDPDGCRIKGKIAFLLNPYDEHALTEAVKVKKIFPGSQITAVCIGDSDARKTIRSAMAMGADRGILIEQTSLPDSILTARALKTVMNHLATPDIIFTGKESIDAEGMQTMFRLGKLFGYPVANNVVALEIKAEKAVVDVDYAGGECRRYSLSIPCVIGAGRDLNKPQYPTFRDIMLSKKKPIDIIPIDSLSFDLPTSSVSCIGLEPLIQEREAKPVIGTLTEMAQKVVEVLKNEAKVL